MTSNSPEQLCIRCEERPKFKHPHTGRVYNLCAVCGLKALAQFLGLEVDENFNLYKPVDKPAEALTQEVS